MSALFAAVLGGIIGSVLGPILVEEYRDWRHNAKWKKPRKELLKKILDDPKFRFKAIDRLSRTIGSTPEETRSLLIELGARGAILKKSKKEGWALIERAPLTEALRAVENDEIEEDS